MDEQAVNLGARRRRSRAEIERLVADYESSGLGRAEFCRKHRLSLSTLARYRKGRAEADRAPKSRWLAVEVSGSDAASETGANSGLTVALTGGRRIEIGRGFDARTLTQLVTVLERI
jgi:transposase-like protein